MKHLMKSRRIDTALISLLGLLAVAEVLYSAIGGEQASVLVLAILLSGAAIVTGAVLIGQRGLRPALGATGLALGIILSVAVTHWPLRVTYACSRSALDAIAQRVKQGESIVTPLTAGLFTIERAKLSSHGIVCLWTAAGSDGNTGFVQCGPGHVPFNLWSMVVLDDRWQYIAED